MKGRIKSHSNAKVIWLSAYYFSPPGFYYVFPVLGMLSSQFMSIRCAGSFSYFECFFAVFSSMEPSLVPQVCCVSLKPAFLTSCVSTIISCITLCYNFMLFTGSRSVDLKLCENLSQCLYSSLKQCTLYISWAQKYSLTSE